MKKWILLLVIQLGFFAGWYGLNQHYWNTSPTVRLELGPIDPYDPIRGRYFILNPKINQETEKAFKQTGIEKEQWFYLIVKNDAEGIARFKRIVREKPSGLALSEYAIRAKCGYQWRNEVDMNVERFYLPSQLQLPHKESEEGWEVEVLIRPDGSAAPKALLFKGEYVYPKKS